MSAFYETNHTREVRTVKQTLFVVSSITYAIKGRDILRQKGFRAYVERAPLNSGNAGCGYSIYVPEHAEEAEKILQASGIRIRSRRERSDAP